MRADILRKKFLEFFGARKHSLVESDSLVPADDPTVLFTPAGMNQFKREFMGKGSGLKRAASSQRCLRTDDLDKVGRTCGHHTFFEMLGNFSFGDYFKDEAISFAWEFLTRQLKIPAEKLRVSVYKDDDEAYGIWRGKIKVPSEKIIRLGDKENFWPSEAKGKGPNGPCGPCSEIFYDQGQGAGCGNVDCDPSCDCDRFIEVWNLVFTQYNRKEGGELEPLPKKNIDTGMGLERLAAVLQGARNNFETDLFRPIIDKIVEQGRVSGYSSSSQKQWLYAVTDHIRAVTFSIYDGVLPSNESRGYIVRKLIRRSALHLRNLGINGAFLYKLVPVVAQIMKAPYPDLLKRARSIAEVIASEEKAFIAMLNTSGALLTESFKSLFEVKDPQKAGRIAFQLYDTRGVPLELTLDWLNRHNIEFSQGTFDKEMAGQKARSKSVSAMKGDVFSMESLIADLKETKFNGYTQDSLRAKVTVVIKDDALVKKASKGDEAVIVLDTTVFYAESGGQAGDTGELKKGKSVFEVLDTKKSGGAVLHIGRVEEGSFKKGDILTAAINLKRRLSIARNHTATHLLQAALRKIFGAQVQQQGSLVAEDKLRFDFTHSKNINSSQLAEIEDIVNETILSNYKVEAKQKTLSEAKKSGALAFFGEKYSGKVRVISIDKISRELCGGSHVTSTGEIGFFRILQEGSIASGVRRIEALTGSFAYERARQEADILRQTASALGVSQDRVLVEIERKASCLKELEKRLGAQGMEAVKSSVDNLLQGAEDAGGVRVIFREVGSLTMDLLRKNVDLIKEKAGSAVVALGANNNGKALLVVGVTQDLCDKIDAGKLAGEAAPLIGGSGGGRKDFAQAGGSSPENFQEAFAKLREIVGKEPSPKKDEDN